MDVLIQQEESVSKGRFFIEKEDKTLAEMTYSIAGPKKIIIDHTEVDPSLKGKKIGFNLFLAVVNYARENNLKVIPLCPFAKAQFDKNQQFNDLLVP